MDKIERTFTTIIDKITEAQECYQRNDFDGWASSLMDAELPLKELCYAIDHFNCNDFEEVEYRLS